MNIETLTVKQICNCVAVINKMTEEKLIKFNPNKACVQFNYDKATRYLEKQNIKQHKQLEAYENMRKETIDFIKKHIRIDDEYPAYMEMLVEEKNELLNILNKVGGSDE